MFVILLYQGFTQKAFYWEFFNILRKIIVEAINQMIPFQYLIAKITAAFLFIFLYMWLQLYINPYKLSQYNRIE